MPTSEIDQPNVLFSLKIWHDSYMAAELYQLALLDQPLTMFHQAKTYQEKVDRGIELLEQINVFNLNYAYLPNPELKKNPRAKDSLPKYVWKDTRFEPLINQLRTRVVTFLCAALNREQLSLNECLEIAEQRKQPGQEDYLPNPSLLESAEPLREDPNTRDLLGFKGHPASVVSCGNLVQLGERFVGEDRKGVYYLSPEQLELHRVLFAGGRCWHWLSKGDCDRELETHLVNAYTGQPSSNQLSWSPFVVSDRGEMFKDVGLASHPNVRFHHSSFMAGEDVFFAGEIKIDNTGKVRGVSNLSGRYGPDANALVRCVRFLAEQKLDLSECEVWAIDTEKTLAFMRQQAERGNEIAEKLVVNNLNPSNKPEGEYLRKYLHWIRQPAEELLAQDKLDRDYKAAVKSKKECVKRLVEIATAVNALEEPLKNESRLYRWVAFSQHRWYGRLAWWMYHKVNGAGEWLRDTAVVNSNKRSELLAERVEITSQIEYLNNKILDEGVPPQPTVVAETSRKNEDSYKQILRVVSPIVEFTDSDEEPTIKEGDVIDLLQQLRTNLKAFNTQFSPKAIEYVIKAWLAEAKNTNVSKIDLAQYEREVKETGRLLSDTMGLLQQPSEDVEKQATTVLSNLIHSYSSLRNSAQPLRSASCTDLSTVESSFLSCGPGSTTVH